jgi:hypothetical protein
MPANIANSANIAVAEGRRGDAIRRINRQVNSLEGEIRRSNGGIGANGMRDDYLVERLEILKQSRDQLQAEIARMNRLTGEELVREFCPEVTSMEALADVPLPGLSDALGRGSMAPAPVVVNRDVLPARHEGPEVRYERHMGGYGGPEGWVPGAVHSPDNSAYRRSSPSSAD